MRRHELTPPSLDACPQVRRTENTKDLGLFAKMAELLLPLSPRVTEMKALLEDFVENHCIPAEATFEEQLGEGRARWAAVPAVMEELKNEARRLGLWNLWLPRDSSALIEFPHVGGGLTSNGGAELPPELRRGKASPPKQHEPPLELPHGRRCALSQTKALRTVLASLSDREHANRYQVHTL